MTEWHRLRKSETAAAMEARLAANKEDVLWQTAHRSFTVAAMKDRQVPRQTGLAILSTVKEAGTALAASSLANVLRGARKSSYISNHPELLALTQFGSEKERDYNEVLMDVLAMWAKGYLRPASAQNKRLEVAPKGQKSLDNTTHRSSD